MPSGIHVLEGRITGNLVPAIFLACNQQNFSGQLIFESDHCTKTVAFIDGKAVEARSTLIDDRLGEILYRQGKITLDKYEETAGKVHKGLRFGDILCASQFFSHEQLWSALQLQSLSIIESLCFYEELHIQSSTQKLANQTNLCLHLHLTPLLQTALSEAKYLVAFVTAAQQKPSLQIADNALKASNTDFHKDMISLVSENPNFNNLVKNKSHLSPLYTTRALWEIYALGFLKDDLNLLQTVRPRSTYGILIKTVEDNNALFSEILLAAGSSKLDGWELEVGNVNSLLQKTLGVATGLYVHPQQGFLALPIVRAYVNNGQYNKFTHKAYDRYSQELNIDQEMIDILDHILKNSLYFLLFIYLNKPIKNQFFLDAQTRIDKLTNKEVTTMTTRVSAHGFDLTESLKEACIQESTERLEQIAVSEFSSNWTLSVDAGEHVAHVRWSDGIFHGDVTVHSDDMYESITKAAKKAHEQLKKHHEKRFDHHSSNHKTAFKDPSESND